MPASSETDRQVFLHQRSLEDKRFIKPLGTKEEKDQFRKTIQETLNLFSKGELTGKEFLERLKGDSRPVSVEVDITSEGLERRYYVTRTKSGKVELAGHIIGELKMAILQIGLDEEGKLKAENVQPGFVHHLNGIFSH